MKAQNRLSIDVPDLIEPIRLDKYLAQVQQIQTRSRAVHLIDTGHVRVNSKVAKASQLLKGNEHIEIEMPEAKSEEIKPLDLKLDIIFEDEDLIVLNKPSGLVVHPAAGHEEDTLVNALVGHTDDLSMKFGENRPGIVHRLDKDTSGLLVIAKNDFTHQRLADQFKERSTHRIYYAIVEGQIKPLKARVESYLARHPTDRKKFASVRDVTKKVVKSSANYQGPGKWAVTDFEALVVGANSSYIKLKLHTGRTHQIRVHMSELGFPLAGDEIYGRRKPGVIVPRLALLAAELGFVHPRSGERLSFRIDWPSDMLEVVQKLGFHRGDK